jgi:hypothetical protein
MQTYTDGRPEGHLRSREASLIAAGHRHGNIGFRHIGWLKKCENNPMHSSRQGPEGRSRGGSKTALQRRRDVRNSA